MADKKGQPADWESFFKGITCGKTVIEYGASRNVFQQGQPADSLFYLRRGKVKLAVTAKDGKEAIVAILDDGGAYDPPEPNESNKYQDFGHSHWHNSLIWGEGLEDIAITGPGLLNGKELIRGPGRQAGAG